MTSNSAPPPPSMTSMTVTTDQVSRVFRWESDAEINVRVLGSEVIIEANAPGLRTLAGHLLTLAQDGAPDGDHLHLEPANGLAEESVALILERADDR